MRIHRRKSGQSYHRPLVNSSEFLLLNKFLAFSRCELGLPLLTCICTFSVVTSPEKFCQLHLIGFETVRNSSFFPSGVYVRHVYFLVLSNSETFNYKILLFESLGFSEQMSKKAAGEGRILPVQNRSP